ncbi:MAG: DUF547 domain-containing protein [Geminicoccaceae bacterium]
MKQFSNEVAQRSTMSRRGLLALGSGLAVTVASTAISPNQALAAPKAELWARWQAHDPASTAAIDHSAWGDLLGRFLVQSPDGINRLAYGKVIGEDRTKLDAYVNGLIALPISTYNRTEQMAYWVNLYNALTVQVVLDHYPVDSIRDIDISPGLFSSGPWGKKLVTIEGERVALDDIEHQILRPIWQDPRIHYAVNCASLGCPNLQPEPFAPATLEQQLDQAAVSFINHPRGASIQGGRLTVSSIYSWFSEDFGSSDQNVIAHLQRYAAPDLQSALGSVSSVDDDRYDWRLNDIGVGVNS